MEMLNELFLYGVILTVSWFWWAKVSESREHKQKADQLELELSSLKKTSLKAEVDRALQKELEDERSSLLEKVERLTAESEKAREQAQKEVKARKQAQQDQTRAELRAEHAEKDLKQARLRISAVIDEKNTLLLEKENIVTERNEAVVRQQQVLVEKAKVESDWQQLQNDNHKLQQHVCLVEELQSNLAARTTEFNKACKERDEYMAAERELQVQLQKLHAQENQLRSNIEKMAADQAAINGEKQQLTNDVAALQQQIQELRSSRDAAQQHCAELNSHLSHFQEQWDVAEQHYKATIDGLQQQLQEQGGAVEQMKAMQQSMDEAQQELDSLQETVQSSVERVLVTMYQALDGDERAVRSAETEPRDVPWLLGDLESVVGQLITKMNEAESAYAATGESAKEQVDNLTREKSELLMRIATLESESQDVCKIMEGQEATVLSLTNALAEQQGESEKELQSLREEIEIIRAQVEGLTQEKEDLSAKLDGLETEKHELLTQIEAEKAKADAAGTPHKHSPFCILSKKVDADEDPQELKATISQLEVELNEASAHAAESNALRIERDQMRVSLAETLQAKDDLAKRVADLEKMCKARDVKLDDLQRIQDKLAAAVQQERVLLQQMDAWKKMHAAALHGVEASHGAAKQALEAEQLRVSQLEEQLAAATTDHVKSLQGYKAEQQRLEAHIIELEKLGDEVATAVAERKKLQSTFDEERQYLEGQLVSARAQQQSCQQRFDQERQELEGQVTELQAALGALQKELDQLKEEGASAAAERQRLENEARQLEPLRAQLAAVLSEMESLQQLETERKDLEAQATKLEAKLSAADKEVEQLRAEKMIDAAERNRLENRVNQLEAVEADHAAVLAEQERSRLQFENERQHLEVQVSELETLLSSTCKEVEQQKAENAAATTAVETERQRHEEELSGVRAELAELQEKLGDADALRARVSELEPQLRRSEEVIQELRAQVKSVVELEAKCSGYENKVSSLSAQVGQLKKQLDETDSLRTRVNKLESDLSKAEKAVEELHAQLQRVTEAEMKGREYAQNVEQLTAEVAHLRGELQAAKDESGKLCEQIELLNKEKTALQTNNEQLITEIHARQKDKAQLQSMLHEVEAELKAQEERFEAQLAEVEEKNKPLGDVTNNVQAVSQQDVDTRKAGDIRSPQSPGESPEEASRDSVEGQKGPLELSAAHDLHPMVVHGENMTAEGGANEARAALGKSRNETGTGVMSLHALQEEVHKYRERCGVLEAELAETAARAAQSDALKIERDQFQDLLKQGPLANHAGHN